ncbi:hypothetical protein B0H10DRAFT_2256416 [Mycena sp. CBHHK59/15]|nr:hypothetical protein B0H10DRAFT_2256416 [Mycena sp. CBHHK59/15]
MASQGSGTPTPTPTPSPGGPVSSPPFIFSNISPPELDISPGSSASPSTRPLKFYDMHLHPNLVLKNVKFLPPKSDMITYFCSIVDDAHGSGEHHLTPDMVLSDETREEWDDVEVTSMMHEGPVADFYRNTTALSTLLPAFNLTFHHSEIILGIKYTQTSPAAPGSGAISDGFLGINPGPLSTKLAEDIISIEDKEKLGILKDRTLCDWAFINWEFKSLVAGKQEVMEEIAAIAFNDGPFPWKYCDTKDDCTNKSQHLNKDGTQSTRRIQYGRIARQ